MKKSSKIVLFGGSGLLGSAIKRFLERNKYNNILSPRSKEVNLLIDYDVKDYLKKEQPEYIFMTAGLVGGILANATRPADFMYINAKMILNLFDAVKECVPDAKVLYTGSTCIYPKENPQPINEDRLLAGPLEETNIGYALAKILGVVGCKLYRKQYNINAIAVMPTNLYGFNDNYDLERGHMLPALIKKFLLAKKNNKKEVILWGTGKPRREALFSDDAADAIVYLMKHYSGDQHINIGTGFDYSIKEIANNIKEEVGWEGDIKWDTSKPDGTFQKKTDITRLKQIYPDFNPRDLRSGVRAILNNEKEIKRILKN